MGAGQSYSRADGLCLRAGKKYCGAVAYRWSRRFVQVLLRNIGRHKSDMPWDWIIDGLFKEMVHLPNDKWGSDDLSLFKHQRYKLAHHIGLKSSRKDKKKRKVDDEK